MARFLIGTMPFISHINPSLPIARALIQRGHQVWWYTGKKFQAKVEATGAHYVPMLAAPDFDEDDLAAVYPDRQKHQGIAQFKWSIKHIFMDAAVGQLADLQHILHDFPADVVLSESTFAGAQFAHELGGPAWATFNILPLTIPSRDTGPFGLGIAPNASTMGRLRNQTLNWFLGNILFRDISQHYNMVRAKAGLPPSKNMGESPFLYLQGTTPVFEYPRSDLPPQVHFIGPFLPEPPSSFTPPKWWAELQTDRPVVLVTQGTVTTNADHLIAPTLQALANQDMLVIATTGTKTNHADVLQNVPANARVEPFLSYHHLMPFVDVVVTNGGYGTVQLALSHGIPVVAGGSTEDKPEVCARIAWSGVGINLRTQTPKLEQVLKAVQRVLADRQFKQRAEHIKASFAQHNAANNAVVLLEQLAETKRPVLRPFVSPAPITASILQA